MHTQTQTTSTLVGLRKYSTTFVILASIGGFIGDVLQPLGPILLYTTVLSAAAAILLTIFRKRVSSRTCLATGFLWIWFACSGVFVAGQWALGASSAGLAANVIPGVAQLQDRMGLVQEKLDQVHAQTTEIKTTTKRIESSVNELGEGIRELGQLGGIVPDPQTPEQWYSNAKLYELKGDFGNARRAYLQCLPKMPNKIDAHLDFIQFLKAQEGRVGAREIYLPIARNNPGVATKVAMAMLLPPMQRIGLLESIEVNGVTPPPVLYLLANQYSEDTLGVQTLSDKQAELKWLSEFVAAKSTQPYLRYFANQATTEEWSNKSTARLAAIRATTSAELLQMPVDLSVDCSDTAIFIDMQVAEPTLDLRYRTSPNTAFMSTGLSAAIDPQTGKRKPNSLITVPHQDEVHLEVMYDNMTGKSLGPFDLSFNSITELRNSQKDVLQREWSKWASYDYTESSSVRDDYIQTETIYGESQVTRTPGEDMYWTTTVIREYFLDLSYLWQRGYALNRVLYRIQGRSDFGEVIDQPQQEMHGSHYGNRILFARDSILPEQLPTPNMSVKLPTRLFINAIQWGSGAGSFPVEMGGVRSDTNVVYLQLEFHDGELSEERAFPFQHGPDPLYKDLQLFKNLFTGQISPDGEVDLRVDPDKRRYIDEAFAWIKERSHEHHLDNARALNEICMHIFKIEGKNNYVLRDGDLEFMLSIGLRANELTEYTNANMLDTLARVYWERKDQSNAIEIETQALEYAGKERVWDPTTNWEGPLSTWCSIMLEWYKQMPPGLPPTRNGEFKTFSARFGQIENGSD